MYQVNNKYLSKNTYIRSLLSLPIAHPIVSLEVAFVTGKWILSLDQVKTRNNQQEECGSTHVIFVLACERVVAALLLKQYLYVACFKTGGTWCKSKKNVF